MKKEIAIKLHTALLSGTYVQCQKALRDPGVNECDTTYCVLGVVCDLYLKEKGKEVESHWDDECFMFEGDYDWVEEDLELPDEVKIWSGIGEEEEMEFVRWNDRLYKNFKQIADKIYEDNEIK